MTEQFVLIHGALHGGWCWDKLVPLLQQEKPLAKIHTPTLLGLGARQAELSSLKGVDLSAQIKDMQSYIKALPTGKTTLVAHSYGALIALALHEAMPGRFDEVILLNGLICDQGATAKSVWSNELRCIRMDQAIMHKGVMCFYATPSRDMGIPKAHREWMDANLTPHPVACYEEPMPLKRPLKTLNNVRYIECALSNMLTASISIAYIKTFLGWPVSRIPSDHEAMITDPELVVAHICHPPQDTFLHSLKK